ncbi:DUF4260 domain-containing protein [Mesorhizobium sp. BR1-1-9]|uniref:DUF4260 domain-containing protein n=1 Tax=unclassified Mesorhizobium TaxID=325217 RepID=UPI001129C248|nr:MULTISPECIES: DUF4260 domain-containing protein [unclassified Mesorhizobium]MBZ9809314.1 DUF4260 domain-containing protein [Mesorhizobium sp. ESP-6-2]MBZ9869979.1 DUF4260 domain-containing protein [Mesorhizobium sp. BR1-1-9]MBZ9943537.1 DUF4260 domain-containing protein [Mesorhizobium sp. BR1-1-13]TPM28958.1 DUF4260 family protein [Mesorhizobium sp. B2-2-2]
MKPLDLAIRLEWSAVAVSAIVFYALAGASWWLFALLILAPDLSMFGYLAGPRVGAACYNAFHILVPPVFLVLAGSLFGNATAIAIALIWIAHIAIDRALGYGLKLSSSFQDTHLGRIGR